jgi:mannose-6-phosphate isomerase-like protein (cupin superfamily)
MTDASRRAVNRTGSWDIERLDAERAGTGGLYLEFLRAADLSAGIYVLEAGEVDGQEPHTEDEVYAVMSGRARLAMGEDDVDVGPGSVAFVAATVPHRFHDIEERLSVLVVFGPAEYSRRS